MAEDFPNKELVDKFVKKIIRYSDDDKDKIAAAAVFAAKKHGDQKRKTGEPYITHPIAVAEILIQIGMDADTVSAGLLHDTLEDTDTTEEEIATFFGREVGEMVQAVTRPAFQDRFAPVLKVCDDYRHMAGKYSFDGIAPLATQLMEDYIAGRNDRVCMVYNHFHSMGRQTPMTDQLLPFIEESVDNIGREAVRDYILEPDSDALLAALLPSATRIRLYRVLLDSVTAENAARMIAMQTATDNAQELIDDLSLEYNKRRQQAITAELADITSSAEA